MDEKLRDLPVVEVTDSRVAPIIKIPGLVLSFSILLLKNEKKKEQTKGEKRVLVQIISQNLSVKNLCKKIQK